MELPEESSKWDCADGQEYIAADASSNIGDNDCNVNYIKDYCEDQRKVIKELGERKLKLQLENSMLLPSIKILQVFLSRAKIIVCLENTANYRNLQFEEKVKEGLKIAQCFMPDEGTSDQYFEEVGAHYKELIFTRAEEVYNLVAESNAAEEELVAACNNRDIWNEELGMKQEGIESMETTIEKLRSFLEEVDADQAKVKLDVENLKAKAQALQKEDIIKEIEMLEEQKATLQRECSYNEKVWNRMERGNDTKYEEISSLRAEMRQKKKQLPQLKFKERCKLHRQMNLLEVVISYQNSRKVKIMHMKLVNKKKSEIEAKIIMCQKYVDSLHQLGEKYKNMMKEKEEAKEESDAKSQKEYLHEKDAEIALMPAKGEKAKMMLKENDDQCTIC